MFVFGFQSMSLSVEISLLVLHRCLLWRYVIWLRFVWALGTGFHYHIIKFRFKSVSGSSVFLARGDIFVCSYLFGLSLSVWFAFSGS